MSARRWCAAAGRSAAARAGTENVAAHRRFRRGGAGRGATVSRPRPDGIAALRDRLEAAILGRRARGGHCFRRRAPRLPNTIAFAVPGLAASTLLMRLDLEGVAASSGSACSSGKVAPSHVLAAMGVPAELARGAIRLSLGWASTEADVEGFAAAFARALLGLKRGAS